MALLCERLESRRLLALPSGFQDVVVTRVATTTASTMAFAPDGRLFVVESSRGQIRIIKDNALLATPFLTLNTSHNGERGINGIAFDPNFATTSPYLYVYYTTATNPVNRLSRFRVSTSNPDVASTTEQVLLDNIPSTSTFHNGGTLHFGTDRMLYLGVGDAGSSTNAQSLSSLSGKVLRLNATNPSSLIPDDNPFINTTGARDEIWARGLRNPFTGAINPTNGNLYINDVGQDGWEEVNHILRGANYGWPAAEGNSTNTAYVNPLFTYQHNDKSAAITGGSFYYAGNFPSSYQNTYFFADYLQRIVRNYNIATKATTTFATNTRAIVDLDVGPDGALWYLALDGTVGRIHYAPGNRAPSAVAKASPTNGLAPLTVNFDGSASSDPDGDPLTYLWKFGDGATSSSAKPSHTYNANGVYSVMLTVNDGRGGSNTSEPTIITVGNRAPVPTINLPASGSLYNAGQTINFSGSASDPDTGVLPASAFTWSFVFHHQTHTHPFLPDRTGIASGSFQIPTTGETDPVQFYRITLTVKDPGGLSGSTLVDVKPRTSTFTINSNVAGATLTLDGQPFTTSKTVTGVVNQTRALSAPLNQTINGAAWEFVSWSNGQPATHNISVPAANTTYTANYRAITGGTQTLRAAADAYVRDGTYANQNFGSASELHVKKSTSGYTREGFLRFAIASIPSIGSAKLRLFGKLSGPESSNVPLGLFPVSSTSWSESAITYNTRPAAGSTALAQSTITDTTARWYEFDVTSYLKQQKSAGASAVSFALKALTASTPYLSFNSDEAASNQPQLIVTASTTTLLAKEDAYVRDGTYASQNFGSAMELLTKRSTSGFNREAYLKFDLSSVSSISSARLRLWGALESAVTGGVNVSAYAVTSTSWSESTLTWNTRPASATTALASVNVNSTAAQWYEWDLTTYLKQEKAAGQNLVAIALKNPTTSTPFVRLNSAEASVNTPQLLIT